MTVKLPQKAGFVPTTEEWDALVRIAENLAAQVVQRDAESLKATFDAHEKINQLSGDLYGAQMALAQAQAERDAARADAALLTDSVNDLGDAIGEALIYASGKTEQILRRALGDDDAALRQPAPTPATSQEWCNCGMGDGTTPELHSPWCAVQEPAPAQGQE